LGNAFEMRFNFPAAAWNASTVFIVHGTVRSRIGERQARKSSVKQV
jgi:hypothetical protein